MTQIYQIVLSLCKLLYKKKSRSEVKIMPSPIILFALTISWCIYSRPEVSRFSPLSSGLDSRVNDHNFCYSSIFFLLVLSHGTIFQEKNDSNLPSEHEYLEKKFHIKLLYVDLETLSAYPQHDYFKFVFFLIRF